MFTYIKREIRFLRDHIGLIGLVAFLFAFGGVLMWINGGSHWYLIRMGSESSGMSAVFAVWLLTYALMGAAEVSIWLIYRHRKPEFTKCLAAIALCSASYLFMLAWYAVFFCTRLILFAAILLILSCIADVVLLILTRRSLLLLTLITGIVLAVQCYFIYFTFAIG